MVNDRIYNLAREVFAISHIGMRNQITKPLDMQLKEDNTPITPSDIEMQKRLILELRKFSPDIPILAEEEGGTLDINLREAVQTGLFSVDPLDGTFSFSTGMPTWSVSVAYLYGGQPEFAIVAQPALNNYFAAERAGGVWRYDLGAAQWYEHRRLPGAHQKFGLDLDRKLAADDHLWGMARKLVQAYRSPIVEPAVSQGVKIALGVSKCWLAAPLKHWDVAATALFVEMCGGVAETLEGGALPWHELQMPPLLFAQSRETATEVRKVMSSS
jgi:fructose-1,6-bisphosphatase/inositol monophosphatase family enzyme